MPDRKWKMGLLRTVRGTMDYVARPRLPQIKAPTLLVAGAEDKVVCPVEASKAVKDLPNGHFLAVPHCGHAPQHEKPWLVNRLVVHFLTSKKPTSHPRFLQLLLAKPTRVTTS
jgi:pimeloyl-ACP methyl ester carboxylesterase